MGHVIMRAVVAQHDAKIVGLEIVVRKVDRPLLGKCGVEQEKGGQDQEAFLPV
jgi:hypothetical protein